MFINETPQQAPAINKNAVASKYKDIETGEIFNATIKERTIKLVGPNHTWEGTFAQLRLSFDPVN